MDTYRIQDVSHEEELQNFGDWLIEFGNFIKTQKDLTICANVDYTPKNPLMAYYLSYTCPSKMVITVDSESK